MNVSSVLSLRLKTNIQREDKTYTYVSFQSQDTAQSSSRGQSTCVKLVSGNKAKILSAVEVLCILD